jgi:hypothetical protein
LIRCIDDLRGGANAAAVDIHTAVSVDTMTRFGAILSNKIDKIFSEALLQSLLPQEQFGIDVIAIIQL